MQTAFNVTTLHLCTSLADYSARRCTGLQRLGQHQVAENHVLFKSKDRLIVCLDAQKRNKKDVEERLAEIEEALRIFSQRRVLVKADDE